MKYFVPIDEIADFFFFYTVTRLFMCYNFISLWLWLLSGCGEDVRLAVLFFTSLTIVEVLDKQTA